ncbi:MAG: hypothetical protein ACYCO3_12015, partial [Mycobacteriales bacterium]
LRAELTEDGVRRVLLAGMGGSSLAAEVIAAHYRCPLTVLDSTDPDQVRQALAPGVEDLAVVVSSKSGGTLETDSHRRLLHERLQQAGIDPARRIVVVTDPGSPLAATAGQAGYRVIHADPNVGGRYSALTAFGLVPTALAGAPVAELLDQAREVRGWLAESEANPGLRLGAVLGAGWRAGLDKLGLAESGGIGFASWVEQLVAESTGKQGRGLLPVVLDGPDGSIGSGASHVVEIIGDGTTYGGAAGRGATSGGTAGGGTAGGGAAGGGATSGGTADGRQAPASRVAGELGAAFLVWEFAVAIAGRVIGIDPFDQPNVAESKENTNRVLAGAWPAEPASFVDGAVEVRADAALLQGASDLAGALAALLAAVPPRGYLAVMAYLNRFGQPQAAGLRAALARRSETAVTFGWGPRFLHSTGQYHKGGPQVGAFLQITGAIEEELAIPGREFGFGRLELAQALGDRQALASRGRPLLHCHLTDRGAGLEQLLSALR